MPVKKCPASAHASGRCLGDSTHQLLRSLYAYSLPNGDWTNHSSVDIWLPSGSTWSLDALGQLVGVAIVNVFGSQLYTTYKRSKMKGSGAAIGRWCGLEAFHVLATHCFPEHARTSKGECMRLFVFGFSWAWWGEIGDRCYSFFL